MDDPKLSIGPWEPYTPAMSLRDWFAGQALGGFYASEDAPLPPGVGIEEYRAQICEGIYGFADAMMKARGELPQSIGEGVDRG